MLMAMNMMMMRNLILWLVMGLSTVSGRCSFLEENSSGHRSGCYWYVSNVQVDNIRDSIGDLICDLIEETREIKQGVANQGWREHHGDCILQRPSGQGSGQQLTNLQTAFDNVAGLMPFMEVLSNVSTETDGISPINLTRHWCLLLRYLSTFIRNQGIAALYQRITERHRTAPVNVTRLRENYASRLHLRFVLMYEAEESLTQLNEALMTRCADL